MEMFLASLPMVYIFRSLFILRERVLLLVTQQKKPVLTANARVSISKIVKAFLKCCHSHSEFIVKQYWFKNSSATGHIGAGIL